MGFQNILWFLYRRLNRTLEKDKAFFAMFDEVRQGFFKPYVLFVFR